MRLYVLLIFTALIMTFFAARFISLYTNMSQFEKPSRSEIASTIQGIQQGLAPVQILDFSELFHSTQQYTDLDPFNFFLANKVQGKKLNFSNPKDCDHREIPWVVGLSSTAKFRMWEDFICGRDRHLPHAFFSSPPIIHPSGESYVNLALSSGIKEFASNEFIMEGLPYFHVEELASLREKGIALPSAYQILSSLNEEKLKRLLDHNDVFINEGLIFIKKDLGFAHKIFDFAFPRNLHYSVYDLDVVNDFLLQTPFNLKEYKEGESCLANHDNVCWNYNLRYFFKMASKGSIIFFIISVFTIILVSWTLLKKLRADKIEEEKKRLALKVLSHEFRTPVTSMILQTELINKKLGELPPELQDQFYEMSANVYRLQRLTEMSKNYLMSGSKDSIAKERVKIVSVNQFIDDLVSDYSGQGVSFFPLDIDSPIYVDPYWPVVCLKNLIDNALAHGKPPVEVILKRSKNRLLIEVTDKGEIPHKKLKKLTTEFAKGNKSEGTGLGLNIVEKVMDLLGGELRFQPNPTTFILVFNDAFRKV